MRFLFCKVDRPCPIVKEILADLKAELSTLPTTDHLHRLSGHESDQATVLNPRIIETHNKIIKKTVSRRVR